MRSHRIRERRERLGLTQAQLGELAGWPISASLQAMVSNVERATLPGRRTQELRQALIWEETKGRRAREHMRRKTARIKRQEALFACVMHECRLRDSTAGDHLQEAMLARCLELMHEGRGEECDAIAEWLPPDAVAGMFARWELECQQDAKCGGCEPSPVTFPA